MTRTIQPAQTESATAEYDPKLPLPYPYHIDDDGTVGRQDFWAGSPYRLLGFQRGKRQHVELTFKEWMAGDPDAAVGMCPVFIDAPTQLDRQASDPPAMWNDSRPITRVVVS